MKSLNSQSTGFLAHGHRYIQISSKAVEVHISPAWNVLSRTVFQSRAARPAVSVSVLDTAGVHVE